MNVNVTEEIVQIKPKTKYLSSTELINLRNVEGGAPSVGLKRVKPENSDEEKHELEVLYDQLERQLSMPRIERLAGRAIGEWDCNVGAVRVLRKDGKFSSFGYNVEGKHYLEYYEAMFLLEVNRLQLEYNSKILSIEQSYLLLMDEKRSTKFSEYLVYSHFTRVGYILVKHQNINFPKHQIESTVDCVWAILEAELQDEAAPDYVKKSPYYANTKKQFDQIKSDIKNQNDKINETDGDNEDIELNFATKIRRNLKRKAEEAGEGKWLNAKKRRHCAAKIFQRSLVDFLKDEDEYKQFKNLFEKFDIVPMTTYDEDESMEEIETLTINFDAYLHNEGFRKSSPHLPNFRVIILEHMQHFPTHKEIYFTHRKQLNPVPLLLVTVNESKQIQAFLYYFS